MTMNLKAMLHSLTGVILGLLFTVTVYADEPEVTLVVDPLSVEQVAGVNSRLPISEVNVALLADEIGNIHLSEGHFTTRLEVMLIWPGDTDEYRERYGDAILFGAQLTAYLDENWYPEFVVANGRGARETSFRTLGLNSQGQFVLFEKFNVEVALDHEMHQYPFGDLDLDVRLSAFSHTSDDLTFVPISFSVGHMGDAAFAVKGNWSLENSRIEVVNAPSMNFGGDKTFSTIVAQVTLEHDFIDTVQKIFFPLGALIIISLCIAQFCSLLFPQNADWRIGGQITLILTIFALRFSLSEDLPSTHYLNFAEALFIGATLVVNYGLVMGIVANHVFLQGKTALGEQIEKVDRVFGPLLTLGLLGGIYGSMF